MKLLDFSIVCAFLQITHQNPLSSWTMKPRVLVLEVDGSRGQHPLSCLQQPDKFMNEDVFWRKNGVDEEQRGNTYLLELEESLGGGNYTCHSKNGSLLYHTEVLLQEEETKWGALVKTNQDYLKCSARNYNGEFQCSWTWHRGQIGKVAFIKARRVAGDDDTQCSGDEDGQHWTCSSGQSTFKCTVDERRNRILCLDEQHCPYAEEIQQIHVTVYVKTEYFLVENYSKHFYLSEIVKPDKVRISKVNTTTIKWSYPSSWSSPYSYFPLTFEILQLRGRCKKCECAGSKAAKILTLPSTDICQIEVKHGVKAVCVRAKDAFCKSEWSEWSHIRLRRQRKQKRQQNK